MLRLIIADDEKIIRETISDLIDWNRYGIDLIGTCRDGIETYNMIVDEYPDIVMTDIKMPGLDGLELIQKVYEIDPDIEFIILSGYNEFEFAKEAMEFGVRHYLLKPISEKQIIGAMEKVKADFYKKRELSNLRYEKELLSGKFQATLKKQFLIEALACEDDLDHLIGQYADLFEFQNRSFALCYVSFLEERHLNEFILFLNALCKKRPTAICFNVLYVKNTAVFVVNLREGEELSALEAGIRSLSFPDTKVEPELRQVRFDRIGDLFHSLIPSLQRYEKIYLIEEDGTRKEIFNYAAFFRQADELSRKLLADPSGSEPEVRSFFSTIDDRELSKTLASRLVVQTAVLMDHRQSHDLSAFLKDVYGCPGVPEIAEATVRQLYLLMKEKEKTALSDKDYIDRALKYVGGHFGDSNLSLKWIAENYLYMNVNYLSKQFSMKTGQKFSAYLNRLRMEKAKELMANQGTEKIFRIAEQVGFGDNSQYFSQVFKKYTGLTPTEYMDALGPQADPEKRAEP